MKRLIGLALLLSSCGPMSSAPEPPRDQERPTIVSARISGGPSITLPPPSGSVDDRLITVADVDARPVLEVTFSEPIRITGTTGVRVYEQRLNTGELPFDLTVSADRRSLRLQSREVMPLGAPRNLWQVYSLDTRIVDDAGLSLDRNTRFVMATRVAAAQDVQLALVEKRRLDGNLFEELTFRNVTGAPLNIAEFRMALEDHTGMGDLGTARVVTIPVGRTLAVGETVSVTRPAYDGVTYREMTVAMWGVSAANEGMTLDRY